MTADIERELVGAVLFGKATNASDARQIVSDSDFTDEVILRVWQAVRDSMEANAGVADISGVIAEVEESLNGRSPPVAWYAQLERDTPEGVDPCVLARLLARIAIDRDVAAIATNGTGDPASVLQRAKKIDELRARRDNVELPPAPVQQVPFRHSGLPSFPIDSLPLPIAEWVQQAARALQVPEELPAMIALSIMAAASSAKYEVQVRGTWREPLGLYTLTTAEPGSRKSAVFSVATAVLYDYQAERQEIEAIDVRRQTHMRAAAELRVENATKRVAKATTPDAIRDANDAYEDALYKLKDTPPARKPYEIIGDDVTPEKLLLYIAEQGGRFACLSAEGGLLKTITGTRYSKSGTPAFDVLLKSHAGDPISQGRKGSDPVFVRRPVLTLGLSVQPEVLRDLASDPAARGVGLLARFCYACPKSTVGDRQIRPEGIDPQVQSSYNSVVRCLLELPQPPLPVILPFSADADDLLAGLEQELEPRLREGADLGYFADWAAKLAGTTARIAALLALADGAGFEWRPPSEVLASHVARALKIAHFLIPHAIHAFETSVENEDTRIAKRILAWCSRSGLTEFSASDAFQNLKGSVGSIQHAADIQPGITRLVSRNLVEPLPAPKKTGRSGRSPSPRYRVL